MSLTVVIGVGIMCFVFIALSYAFKGSKHKYIRPFFLFLVIPFMFLIPGSMVLEQTNCDLYVNSTTVTGNTTTHTYAEQCFEDVNGSVPVITSYKIIFGVFMVYVMLLLLAEVYMMFKKLVKKQ